MVAIEPLLQSFSNPQSKSGFHVEMALDRNMSTERNTACIGRSGLWLMEADGIIKFLVFKIPHFLSGVIDKQTFHSLKGEDDWCTLMSKMAENMSCTILEVSSWSQIY